MIKTDSVYDFNSKNFLRGPVETFLKQIQEQLHNSSLRTDTGEQKRERQVQIRKGMSHNTSHKKKDELATKAELFYTTVIANSGAFRGRNYEEYLHQLSLLVQQPPEDSSTNDKSHAHLRL
jgi:hypothetical protein